MKLIALGLRVLLGTGRDSALRLMLMAAGACVGAVALLALASIPNVYQAQSDVLGRQQLVVDEAASAPPLRAALVDESVGGRPLTRIALAVLDDTAAPPAWIDRYPADGEMVVSPAFADLISSDASLKARYPQTQIQQIDENFTIAPDQLYVIVGVSAEHVPENTRGVVGALGFGPDAATLSGPNFSAVRLIAAGAAIFVLLPTLLLLATTARLSARTRRDRLAALRLIGLSTSQTRIVATTEIAVVTTVGALAGAAAWAALRGVSQRVGIGDLRWFARDITVTPTVAAAVLAVLVAGSLISAHTSISGSISSPLAERQPAPPNNLQRRRLLPLGTGVALLLVAVAWTSPSNQTIWYIVFVAGNILTAIGIVVAMPAIATITGTVLRRTVRQPWTTLAARRMTFDPYSISRIATGLLVVVLVAGVGQSLILVLDWAINNTDPAVEAAIDTQVITVDNAPLTTSAMSNVRAVDNAIGLTRIPTSNGDTAAAVVATCEQLQALVNNFGDTCDANAAQPLSIGGNFVEFQIPDTTLGQPLEATLQRADGSVSAVGDLRIGPELLSPDSPLPREWYLTMPIDADTAAVADQIIAAAPAADVDTGDTYERGRLAATYRTLVTVATGFALIVGAFAVAVSLVDRTIERRRTASELLALGVPGRILRLTEALWVAAPLVVGLTMATIATTLAGTAYARFGDATLRLPASDIALIIGLGLVGTAMAVVAAIVATPTTTRLDRTGIR
ncbi:FtsX-like permease family protein [Ilumatobacter sp.]|uniref:FtsX-like permease family protein n=1 Tax=Ilumatobacter sp. TaxID=1967498 RepID=UPI003752605F